MFSPILANHTIWCQDFYVLDNDVSWLMGEIDATMASVMFRNALDIKILVNHLIFCGASFKTIYDDI